MTYGIVTPRLGVQPIADTSTTQLMPLGTIVKAYDSTYGEGEFIYLLGIGSTIVGSLVRYNALTWQTVLVVNTAVQVMPVAVAMSANVAAQYGWYQISGNAVLAKTAVIVLPNVAVYISATAGKVKAIASAGLQVVGCRSGLATTASASGTVVVTIDRPHLQSQIT